MRKEERRPSKAVGTSRIPWYRHPRTRAIVIQIVFAIVVFWSIYTVFTNTITNLQSRGIQTSFGFLDEVAPFNVGFSPFIEFELGVSQYWEVFLIGIGNTFLVGILGVIAAGFFGFIVGVLRLSPNWLVSRIASVYIETVRNVPLLLQIMFWNFAVLLPSLPGPRQSLSLGDAWFLNNRGFYLPAFEVQSAIALIALIASFVIAVSIVVVYRHKAKRLLDEKGKSLPVFLPSLAIIIALPLLSLLLLGDAITFDYPVLEKFNYVGGLSVPLPLFVLWFSLTFYTTAFIAENVRGGIKAISHGQSEAAESLGLRRSQCLKLIIIPQAMRVIIPPTISQFLNLVKNSSLAVAIAYEDVVNIWSGIALNQTGQALIIIAMTILVYEVLSLATSAFLNWYNAKVQLVER